MAEKETNNKPFRGGMNKYLEPALLPSGTFSDIVNFRQMHPGMKARLGQIKLHTTADGTNRVMSGFQFSKSKLTERHFYVQMSDGDVLEATTAPPGVTTGAFGSEVHDGTASGLLPASWSVNNDVMLYSNGSDQHQICYGNTTYVEKFIVYKGAAAIPDYPVLGEDYSEQVSDGLTTTAAILDSLGDLAVDYDCVFIKVPVPIKQLTWTVSLPNGTAATAQMKYRKTDNTWAAVSDFVDNTSANSKTLAQTGSMTWTTPTDSMPSYMFSSYGYWYQWSLASGDLDSEVEVTSVTFEHNWASISDLWDGSLIDCIEAQFNDVSVGTSSYYTYGGTSVTLNNMVGTSGTEDFLYIASPDPIDAVFIDVGSTPSTTTSNSIDAFSYWNGTAWASIGSFTDSTVGFMNSGFIFFARRTDEQKHDFNESGYYAYWYKLTVASTLSASVNAGFYFIPKYDISQLGKGVYNAVWKDGRTALVFSRFPSDVYITAQGNPQILSSSDSAIVPVGDGRANKVVAIKKFYNELIVAQEEKGTNGGCITLIQGTEPKNYGIILLSNKFGVMNSQCLKVVEGFEWVSNVIITAVFGLSKYGIWITDGMRLAMVPGFDNVKNYFDLSSSDCIRQGYESQMWLKYDSAYNILRIGLVSGSSATVCNVWLIYDLMDKTFSRDDYYQPLAFMTEAEAASGNVPTLQVGGGTADGYVYLLNSGLNDVTTAIDAYNIMEIDGNGKMVRIDEMILRMKVQSAGNCTITPYINSVSQTAITKSQTAEVANQTIRKHRFNTNLKGQHISLKFEHNTASESFYLLDLGLGIEEYKDQ